MTPGQLERWFFVGITRATQWVYFSTVNNNQFMFLDRFQDLQRQEQVAIKIAPDLLADRPGSAPTRVPGKQDDGLIEAYDLSNLF